MNITSYKQAAIIEKQNFTRNLVFLRELKGYRAKDVVRFLGHGLKLSTYQAWEEQRSFPPPFICRLICRLFKVDMETMFTERFKET